MQVLNPQKFINSINELEKKEAIMAIFNYINIDGKTNDKLDEYDYSFRGYHYNDFKFDLTLKITQKYIIVKLNYQTTLSSKSFNREIIMGFNNRPKLEDDVVSTITTMMADIRLENKQEIGDVCNLLFNMEYVGDTEDRPMLLNNYIFNISTICNVIKDSLEEFEEEYLDGWEGK